MQVLQVLHASLNAGCDDLLKFYFVRHIPPERFSKWPATHRIFMDWRIDSAARRRWAVVLGLVGVSGAVKRVHNTRLVSLYDALPPCRQAPDRLNCLLCQAYCLCQCA